MGKKKPDRKRVEQTSADLAKESIARLREVFPEAVTEGKIDFTKLRETLGDEVDDRPERYSFTWAGKRDAIRLLQTPSRATLVPAPKESVDFDETQNLFIEGENLEVLKLLYKSYAGRVKMIYIDPPYNTGNDFIYPDDFRDPLDTYLKLTGQKDSEGNLLTSNPETSGRYHSAWLSMMYPRLFVARQLLSEDGVVFISIDEHEICNLRMLMNEVFGEENFVETFVWKKSYGGGAKEKFAVRQHEYIIMYARSLESLPDLWLPPNAEAVEKYYKYRDDKFEKRGPYRLKPLEASKSMDRRENLIFPVSLPWGGKVMPKRQWWWSRERVAKALAADELVFTRSGKDASVSYKQYLIDEEGEERGTKPFSVIDKIYTQAGTEDLSSLFPDRVVMQFPKPVALIRQLLSLATDPVAGDIVMDFFAGSATAAQAVLETNRADGGNRRYIMCQMPEVLAESLKLGQGQTAVSIADIGKERIRRVIKKLNADSKGKLDLKDRDAPEDLGFRVFKLAESHYRSWKGVENKDGAAYAETMELFTDPLVPGWKPMNVIYEAALKEGYGLTSTIEQVYPPVAPKNKDEKESAQSAKSADRNVVYLVTDADKGQSFRICLDDKMKAATVKALALKKDDLFICRDAALTDEMAANLALQCNLKTI
jgi:adenine-specific DNA-methyltransferase